MKLNIIQEQDGIKVTRRDTLHEFLQDYASELSIHQSNEICESLENVAMYTGFLPNGALIQLERLDA